VNETAFGENAQEIGFVLAHWLGCDLALSDVTRRLITWANGKGTVFQVTKIRTIIGLMSGTSMDGIDIALIRTDGNAVSEFGPFRTYDFSEPDRNKVKAALIVARTVSARDERPADMARAEEMITERHIEAVERFIADFAVERHDVDAVGFHGQTVFHDPAKALTIQIGDGQELADRLDMPVVWDMRADDIAAGGQGAPLAPAFHRALADSADLPRPAVFLNIGGVANITWIGPEGDLVAFDCGPGNALIDDWIRAGTDDAFDRDGAIARSGAAPQADKLEALLRDEYFHRPPPKSLDRDHFTIPGLSDMEVPGGARLLTQFSVEAIARSVSLLPADPEIWVATGGGRRNKFMMEMLADALDGRLVQAEDCGFDGDAIEAQAFAYLAARRLEDLPLTFPGTTGIAQPLTGGRLSLPARKP
jgi:anhydro-N-acetylmuramic acid kinase